MKILQVLVLTFGLSILTNAQKAILSGNVYDANGALIVGAKVAAINEKGEKVETVTNDDGIYTLSLSFNPYNSKADFRLAKYEIIVDAAGFEKNSIKDFGFVPSSNEKMQLDFALNVKTYIDPIIVNSTKKKRNRIKLKGK